MPHEGVVTASSKQVANKHTPHTTPHTMNGFVGLLSDEMQKGTGGPGIGPYDSEGAYAADEWRRLSIVALVLDGIAARVVDEAAGIKQEFAVIRRDPEDGEVKVLYCVTAPSKSIAFYMMCVDACDTKHHKHRDHVSELDPEYRTLRVEDLLRDVGERALWQVDKVWDCFVEFCDSGEIEPYSIVEATRDHYFFSDFQ